MYTIKNRAGGTILDGASKMQAVNFLKEFNGDYVVYFNGLRK